MFNLNLISLIFFITFQGICAEITQHRHEVLDQDGNFIIDWTIDYDIKEVVFEAVVRTTGFVGFGISPTGGMKGADIVIGGFYPNGTSYFTDRFGMGEFEPVIDDQQDWNFLGGSENGSHTVLKFSRQFDSCSEFDVALTNDTTNFIWSYGSDNTDDIKYHGPTTRGTYTVQPLDPEVPPMDVSKLQSYEITHNLTMPSVETTYWCTIHKSPTFEKKHHIVAFEPKLNTPEARVHTHHYNIYRCTAPNGLDPNEYFEPFVGQPGGECFVPNPIVPSADCQNMFYNWAVGGKMIVLPEDIGYPIGETGSPVDYYMFEIHLHNPQELSGLEFEYGATIFYTDELREQDAGLMVVAHHTSIALTVPPKSTSFKTVGHCDPYCTNNFLPEDGINIFGIFLHSHLSGRKMKLRHFRGNEELPWASSDENYDFNFQQTRPLSQELKILPGDQLTTECTYDTTWKEGTTVGGLSNRDEMCLAIFWYYPRAELRDCRSEYPVEKLFQKFGIEDAIRNTMYEDAVITSPPKYANMTYSQVLNTMIDWTSELREEVQRDSNFASHVGVCWTTTGEHFINSTGYPEITEDFKPIRECPHTNSSTDEKAW